MISNCDDGEQMIDASLSVDDDFNVTLVKLSRNELFVSKTWIPGRRLSVRVLKLRLVAYEEKNRDKVKHLELSVGQVAIESFDVEGMM